MRTTIRRTNKVLVIGESSARAPHLFVLASAPGNGLGVGKQVLHLLGRPRIAEVEFACGTNKGDLHGDARCTSREASTQVTMAVVSLVDEQNRLVVLHRPTDFCLHPLGGENSCQKRWHMVMSGRACCFATVLRTFGEKQDEAPGVLDAVLHPLSQADSIRAWSQHYHHHHQM